MKIISIKASVVLALAISIILMGCGEKQQDPPKDQVPPKPFGKGSPDDKVNQGPAAVAPDK
jgi:uncharacterized lipoprotein NlpE involved in copper resistance